MTSRRQSTSSVRRVSSVAAKRADRETSEGAVLVRIQGTKVLSYVSAARRLRFRHPDFKALAAEIADAAIASFPADIEA